jgi:prevent-host-death family protein
MKMSAAEFKAKCLKIMDQVNSFHHEIVITKHGKPIAKLVPYSVKPSQSLFGYLKNSVTIKDDITKPIDAKWNAE